MNNSADKVCTIHFIKALSGDCLLIELSNRKCLLIDCGYRSTYKSELRPLLQKKSREGCTIALLVITHYDEDHIGGAIDLIKENGDSLDPKIIKIENIWFNGLLDICLQNKEILNHLVNSILEKDNKRNKTIRNNLLKLISDGDGCISAKQAEIFELLCKENNYQVNAFGQNGLIIFGSVLHIGECRISVLSPSHNEVGLFAKWIDRNLIDCFGKNYQLLKEDFIDYIDKVVLARGRDDNGAASIEQISAGSSDVEKWIGTSSLAPMNAANRMSIVIEIEICGNRMLFCGDSESEDWVSRANGEYDIVKLSHHGSCKPNLCLLEKIKFKKAIISTNGRKNHPENDLLARLIKKKVEILYFNYDIRQKEELLFCKKYGFEAHFGESTIEVC